MPPIGLQRDFQKQVQQYDATRSRLQASATKSNNLFNSLVQRAFKGEL